MILKMLLESGRKRKTQMGSLTVVERNTDCQDVFEWPLRYMNDFSVLGLRVEGLSRALEVLEAGGYHVVRRRCSATISFENRDRFKNIFETLARQRIEHGMSDLMGCAYQG
jgi:hypothetical protein